MSKLPAPEDAVVITEVLNRLCDAVGSLPMRADGAVNQRDLYAVLDEAYKAALAEAAHGDDPWTAVPEGEDV